jgi:uncharacterized protein (TIGR02147 family)
MEWEMSIALPFNTFQYSSHLEFLQDAYAYAHSQDEKFSYDRIAELCGFKSRTEARNFVKGTKKANDSQLLAFARTFSLSDAEAQYLVCLAKFSELSSSRGAFDAFQKLVALQKQNAPTVSPFREIEIATSVLHMTLLAYFDLTDAPKEPVEIVARLKNRYEAEAIKSAIVDLVAHGYLRREPDGRFAIAQKHIKKYDYNSNFFLRRFHQESLDIVRDALENEATSERYLVGASFCINAKVFPRIVQKMNAFVENLMSLEGVAGTPDTVVQFNQQLVRMTSSETANESGLGREATERAFAEPKHRDCPGDAESDLFGT